MMDYDNPYAIQEVIGSEPITADAPLPEVRRFLAIGLAMVSVVGSMVFVYASVRGVGNPWPMVVGVTIVSLISAIWTRDRLLAPLPCFAGIMGGACVAGLIRGWGYADIPMSLAVAAGCSVPALLLSMFVYWRRKNQLRMEVITGLDEDLVETVF